MTKSVGAYKYIMQTYGRRPTVWFAFVTELIRTVVTRVFTVVILANMGAQIAVGEFDDAKQSIVLFLVVSISAAILGAVGDLVAVWGENQQYEELLLQFYKKLTLKDMAFYRSSHTGALTAMFRQFLDGGMTLVRVLRTEVLRLVISLTFPVFVLLYESWKIGLIALVSVLIQALYVKWASSQANKYRLASHRVYREINALVTDDITNIVAYRSAGQEKIATAKIEKLRTEETNAFWMRRKMGILLDLPRGIITSVLAAAAFWVVLDSGAGTQESVALVLLTLTYMFQILRNANHMAVVMAKVDDLVTKLEPALEMLDEENETVRDVSNPEPLNAASGYLEIKNLSFSYNDESKKVFSKLNIDIPGGTSLGVVGLSGAGKSTLANLIMRFDDIDSGEILIDGVNIADVGQSELRRNIAYVPQEPLLFHRTISENVAYHNEKANSKDIRAAATAAHAHEFIKDMPERYETIVGERGVKLSGGQKQRIAIARAILKKAPIMLFDEATSALDSESEHIRQKALPEIIGKQTAIVIAHRLSTVAGLDSIVVMDKGKVVEQGTHTELLKQKGKYYSLWQKQSLA